ncbi:MAG: peptidase U32 family protein [Thermodesulforhabdaceae bacterium]
MMKKPELLAPAGSVESFRAAVEAGADAVYVGLRGWNARASAHNFTLDECADLLAWGATKGIKIHIALNGLVLTGELRNLCNVLSNIADLAGLESFGGLIVQDTGVVFLARRFFPQIPLHLSTLAGIHNLQGVQRAARWGIRRVVLAREVPIEEAVNIAKESPIEIEVFIHGALCFSFSGFCLASSFRGGRSGLRGECAQPCRLKFHQGRREGYFLSCNDFSALSVISRIKQSSVAALKIEGRLKSPDYVSTVVKAYRMVLDAKPEEESERIAEAEELLKTAPSRRLSQGFWSVNPSQDVLTPHLSGTSGIWVATIESKADGRVLVRLRDELRPGDVVRPETSRGREESLRTVKKIHPRGAGKGDLVEIEGLADLPVGTKLFLVGRTSEPRRFLWQAIRSEIPSSSTVRFSGNAPALEELWEGLPDKRRAMRKGGTRLIVKVGSPADLPAAFHSPADWVMMTATLNNLETLSRMRLVDAQKKRLVLSLPAPVIGWTERTKVYQKAVEWFVSRGFLLWEVNNAGHVEILREALKDNQKIGIFGGVRLNVRNPAAIAHWAEEGCFAVTLSPEMTRDELSELIKYPMPAIPIVSVFSWLPLMVSLLEPKLMEQKPFITERGDKYYYVRRGGLSFIYADRPVSLFGKLGELTAMGYYFFLLDVSEGPWNLSKELPRLISGFRHERDDEPFSDFNWRLSKESIKLANK